MKKGSMLWVVLLVVSLFCSGFGASFAGAASPKDIPVPGGKWRPDQLEQHAELLKQLGLEVDVKELSRMDTGLLRAIVSLGFCSGSFISPNGLIITNHHCVQGLLSYMSQEDLKKGIKSDYVKNGFLAKTRQEERWAGPTQKIFITRKIDNVSKDILDGIDTIQDPVERVKAIEQRVSQLEKKLKGNRADVRVDVKSFYRGSQYFAIEQLELRDIRVVYAPPAGVGYFGGDTDNWHWPRQTGDFGVLRAYVANDGSSAEYDLNNVPYRNEKFLKIARTGNEPYKLVFVAGYPGSTSRLLSASEARDRIVNILPEYVAFYTSLKETLDRLSKNDKDIDIKTESVRFSLSNVIKKNTEALKSMESIGFHAMKEKAEKEMLAWIDSDFGRAHEWGSVVSDLVKMDAKYSDLTSNLVVDRFVGNVDLVRAAVDIVRMAEERSKQDDQREPAYQERRWKEWIRATEKLDLNYSEKVTNATAGLVLSKHAAQARAIPSLERLLDGDTVKESDLAALFSATAVASSKRRIELFQNATVADLKSLKDPVIELAFELVEIVKQREIRAKAYSGEMKPVLMRYMDAVHAFAASKGESVAADANSSLRVTFGQVKGYYSKPRDKFFAPFTDIQSLIAKHKINDAEFEVPYKVQQAAARGNFANYADEMFGTLPINFLAGVDTTGGNSGSAAVNGKGELVGLLFDGSEDTLYSDWVYNDKEVRSILLDIRYFLWTLDEVEGAHHLLKEMTITPKCERTLTEVDPTLVKK